MMHNLTCWLSGCAQDSASDAHFVVESKCLQSDDAECPEGPRQCLQQCLRQKSFQEVVCDQNNSRKVYAAKSVVENTIQVGPTNMSTKQDEPPIVSETENILEQYVSKEIPEESPGECLQQKQVISGSHKKM